MMSTNSNVSVVPESPTARRIRSCSSSSVSSSGSKQGKSPVRKSSSLPAETVEYLKAWMMSPEHVAHPYPTESEKAQIMADTGIELKQLTNWFVNNRKRYWKPRVEARLQQQAQVQAAAAAAAAVAVAQAATSNRAETFNAVAPQPYISLDMTQPPPLAQHRRVSTTEEQPDQFHGQQVSVVGSDNISAFVPKSHPHPVSEASSSASESDNMSDSIDFDDDSNAATASEAVDNHSGVISRTEMVDVHVLCPMGGAAPTIEDISILSTVPAGRIVKSYKSCPLTFHFLSDIASDRKKVQSRRDLEVVRLKKHYLKLYLDEEKTRAAEESQKRKRTRDDASATQRRTKFLRKSPMVWREACHEANNCFDDALPTLEEAAHLFGFLQASS